MGAFLGLVLGTGLLLMWRSGPRRPVKLIDRPSGLTSRRTALLAQAGIRGVSSSQLWILQVAAAVVLGLVVLVATRSVAIAAAFTVFGFFGPHAMIARLQRRRSSDMRAVWPEAVDHLASGVRAGLSIPEALGSLSVRGPEPLRPTFAAFAADYRASGRFVECLDLLKDRLADPVGDRVCETLRVTRQVGGTDLGTVLRTLAQFLREDARIRAELETRQGWQVNAARLAVGAPWLILLLLGTQSTTLAAYDTPAGLIVLLVGAGVCLAAYRLMLKLGQIPAEQRVLS